MSTMIQTNVEPTVVYCSDGDGHSEESCSSSVGDGHSEEFCSSSSGSDYENEILEETPELKPKKWSAVDEVLLSEIMAVVTEGGDINKLKLDHCKAYLRKYGLRLTGKKAVLLDRIQEHMEIKNGGEAKYRREDFSINCTGDVCQGDLIVFEQKVYEKFDVASRSARGTFLGTRTVAGRVVKESYGAAKQQHTFTIEVLWSLGTKQLPPLQPLLVKGRNLYRLNTCRQPWANEAERKVVLQEKHNRGGIARAKRAASKSGFMRRPPLKPITNENIDESSSTKLSQTQNLSSHISSLLGPGPNHLCGKPAGLPPVPAVPANPNFVATGITCSSCHNSGARSCISRLCYYCCRRTAKFCERHSELNIANIRLGLR